MRFEERRGEWMLLAPERIFKLDGVAVEILKRCDGRASLDAIINDLAQQFEADRAEVAGDVRELLSGLAAKGMLEL